MALRSHPRPAYAAHVRLSNQSAGVLRRQSAQPAVSRFLRVAWAGKSLSFWRTLVHLDTWALQPHYGAKRLTCLRRLPQLAMPAGQLL